MSKQYLTVATADNAHVSDIFALVATPRTLLSASGASSIHVHDTTTSPEFPIRQTIPAAHKLGCHHICASRDGTRAASVGFGGEVRLWELDAATGDWVPRKGAVAELAVGRHVKAAEAWAPALTADGRWLALTTTDGKINVWDLADAEPARVYTFETGTGTAGSFGMCVDLSRDGKFTASGHQNGAVYVFDNETRRLVYSLQGLAKPVRAVAFSPKGTRLAAAGDAGIIALYDTKHGEQVGSLTGHGAWIMSLDWSDTGEWLLSGAMDGKVKVWSVERTACVATHSETEQGLWAVRWLPPTAVRGEMFCAAGANRSITFYREATGGN